MTADDVQAADETAWAALHEQVPPQFAIDDDVRAHRGRLRIAHLQRTDPGGAWVAEDGGEIVGVALALVREGVWGLSLFGVRPELQGRGTGRKLLDATLRYAEGCRGAIILSTPDPRAMRRYARAGFALRAVRDARRDRGPRRDPRGPALARRELEPTIASSATRSRATSAARPTDPTSRRSRASAARCSSTTTAAGRRCATARRRSSQPATTRSRPTCCGARWPQPGRARPSTSTSSPPATTGPCTRASPRASR